MDPTKAKADPPVRPSPVRRTILLVLLTAGGVFAAWQVHVFFQRGRSRPAAQLPRDMAAVSRPAFTHSGPADSLAEALAEEGIRFLEDDPAGIAPPPGAQRLWSMGFSDGSAVARYRWSGPMGQAAEHYRNAMKARGFELGADRFRPDGRRALSFFGGPMRATVTLLPRAGSETIITVTLLAPPPA